MPSFQGSCSHDHDCGEEDCSVAYSLYKNIDTPRVRCLNEKVPGSCRGVFKPWHERLNRDGTLLRSQDDDPELLLYVPLDGSVTLKAICVIGGDEGSGPAKMRAYINRDDLDFGMVESLAPVQEWDLVENGGGLIEYPTQVSKFNGVHSLTLHFPETLNGSDDMEIRFIGFKGTIASRDRRAVEAVYEAKPMPSDHKVPDTQGSGWSLG